MKTRHRFLLRFALPVLLLLAVTGALLPVPLCPAGAQQANAVQVKPSQASKVTVQANPLWEPHEPALASLVTVEVSGQSVQELLQGLNVVERPKLQAKDPTGWRNVTVYAHQQPVSKVMMGLQILFNDVWVRNSLDPTRIRYILTATGRSEAYDKELYRLTLERGAEPLLRLTEYLRTPEEAYERMKLEVHEQHKELADPLLRGNLYYLSRSGPRDGLAFLQTLSPEQRFSLLSEGTYFLPASAMTQLQVRKAHNMGLASGRLQERIGRLLEGETPEDHAALGDQFGLAFSARIHPVTGALLGCDYSNGIGGLSIASTDNLPSPMPLLAVRGNPYHFSPGSKPKLPVYPDLQKRPFPPEFTLEKGKEYAWRDVVVELSKHVSLSIYSDDFSFTTIPQDRLYGGQFDELDAKSHPLAARPKLTNLKLPEALDALCNQYGYLWWYQEGALFFRSRTWFLEQLYEVPPPVLALVRKQLENEGKLNVEGVTALSTLTKKQLMGLSLTNMTDGPEERKRREEIGARRYDSSTRIGLPADAEIAWRSLQIFALLNEEQKNKALSSEGLPFTEMSREAQQGVFQALYTRQSVMLLTKPENIHLVVRQHVDPPAHLDGPRQANIEFSLTNALGSAPVAIRTVHVKTETIAEPKRQ